MQFKFSWAETVSGCGIAPSLIVQCVCKKPASSFNHSWKCKRELTHAKKDLDLPEHQLKTAKLPLQDSDYTDCTLRNTIHYLFLHKASSPPLQNIEESEGR